MSNDFDLKNDISIKIEINSLKRKGRESALITFWYLPSFVSMCSYVNSNITLVQRSGKGQNKLYKIC